MSLTPRQSHKRRRLLIDDDDEDEDYQYNGDEFDDDNGNGNNSAKHSLRRSSSRGRDAQLADEVASLRASLQSMQAEIAQLQHQLAVHNSFDRRLRTIEKAIAKLDPTIDTAPVSKQNELPPPFRPNPFALPPSRKKNITSSGSKDLPPVGPRARALQSAAAEREIRLQRQKKSNTQKKPQGISRGRGRPPNPATIAANSRILPPQKKTERWKPNFRPLKQVIELSSDTEGQETEGRYYDDNDYSNYQDTDRMMDEDDTSWGKLLPSDYEIPKTEFMVLITNQRAQNKQKIRSPKKVNKPATAHAPSSSAYPSTSTSKINKSPFVKFRGDIGPPAENEEPLFYDFSEDEMTDDGGDGAGGNGGGSGGGSGEGGFIVDDDDELLRELDGAEFLPIAEQENRDGGDPMDLEDERLEELDELSLSPNEDREHEHEQHSPPLRKSHGFFGQYQQKRAARGLPPVIKSPGSAFSLDGAEREKEKARKKAKTTAPGGSVRGGQQQDKTPSPPKSNLFSSLIRSKGLDGGEGGLGLGQSQAQRNAVIAGAQAKIDRWREEKERPVSRGLGSGGGSANGSASGSKSGRSGSADKTNLQGVGAGAGAGTLPSRMRPSGLIKDPFTVGTPDSPSHGYPQ